MSDDYPYKNNGWAWCDTTPDAFEIRLERAVSAYQSKFGLYPSIVYVNADSVGDYKLPPVTKKNIGAYTGMNGISIHLATAIVQGLKLVLHSQISPFNFYLYPRPGKEVIGEMGLFPLSSE